MGFQLPEFARRVWRTPAEQAWWEARFTQFHQAWAEVERESVAAGLRAAAYQTIPPGQLPALTKWTVRNNLVLLVANQVGLPEAYQGRSQPAVAHQPWTYRVLITRMELATDVFDAADRHDHDALGAWLGYPACCRAMFARTWGQHQIDSTWEAYEADPKGPPETNVFLRSAGIRLVPHMPCSATCADSIALGHQFAALGRRLPHGEAIDAAYEILDWPLAWSRVHGLTEIMTPAMKIVTSTDYTPTLQALVRGGVYTPPDPKLWQENGFANPGMMLTCHGQLLDACRCLIAPGERVLDLGAGNGRLLALLRQYLGVIPTGVEKQPIQPIEPMGWVTTDIAQTPAMDVWGDAVLLMPGRISEIRDPAAAQCVRNTVLSTKIKIVYGYKDNLARAKGLVNLTMAAGLPAPTVLHASDEIAIGLIP